MEICVGVEVSKQHLDWAIGGSGTVHRATNTSAGIRQLVACLGRIDAARIVVESIGGYERALVEALDQAGLQVVFVNPWRVRRFGGGVGALAKTDPLDARMLALFGERAQPVSIMRWSWKITALGYLL